MQTDSKEAATAIAEESQTLKPRRKAPYTEDQLRVYDRYLATVTALLTLLGAFGTVFVYLQDQRTKHESESKLKKQELDLREAEMNSFLYNDKRDAYYALVDAVSKIAACRNVDEVSEASKDFFKLYYGRAHLVIEGDFAVFNAKIEFGRALREYLEEKPEALPSTIFGGLALDITDACRQYLDPRPSDSDESAAAPRLSAKVVKPKISSQDKRLKFLLK
jgi:hypothetical protein